MNPKDLPLGEFPGTNTQPVLDGTQWIPQDADLFGDEDGEAY